MNDEQIRSLARETVLRLKPYSSAREEFTGTQGVFLDANENPYNQPFNRYPDPLHIDLRSKLGEMKGVNSENIIVGNGSDEVIDMMFRTFCHPEKDNVISVSPSYGMYKVSASIHDIEYRTVLLNEDFSLKTNELLKQADRKSKLMFICSPNNPTGNRFADEDIEFLLREFKGLVVIDEAYADFNNKESWVKKMDRFPNLVVLQTLSKAFGLAAIRLGMGFATQQVIDLMLKVKPPYNVNAFTQQKALDALENENIALARIERILENRDMLIRQLNEIPGIVKVFPTDANFFLIKVDKPDELYHYLVESGIIVRNRSKEPLCSGCLRISVGTEEQNILLLDALKSYYRNLPPINKISTLLEKQDNKPDILATITRKTTKSRKTAETQITVEIDLDGKGQSEVDTGLGFFDHMLDQIARHSGCDLKVKVEGDLHVDEHHTLEDTAITLGEAFHDALGDKKGIERYGFALPMDESAALVLLDFGGRPDLVWEAEFKREKIGELPTEMFKHIFKSFAIGAKCNLYIKAKGENEHHKIEAIFKGLARSIRQAIKREPGADFLPSTKEML